MSELGTMCILLTVADKHRSATARGLNGKRPCLVGFCCFRPQCSVKVSLTSLKAENSGNRPSAGRPSLGANINLCEHCVLCGSRRLFDFRVNHHCRTVPPMSIMGEKLLKPTKRKLPAISTPAAKRPLIRYDICRSRKREPIRG